MSTCVYGNSKECCDQTATRQIVLNEWMDDHFLPIDAWVCDEHYHVLAVNDDATQFYNLSTPAARAHFRQMLAEAKSLARTLKEAKPLKVGDKAFLPPHSRAILRETGREVLVNEDDTILGTQSDTMTAELLIGQPVVWVDDNTVKLKETA